MKTGLFLSVARCKLTSPLFLACVSFRSSTRFLVSKFLAIVFFSCSIHGRRFGGSGDRMKLASALQRLSAPLCLRERREPRELQGVSWGLLLTS